MKFDTCVDMAYYIEAHIDAVCRFWQYMNVYTCCFTIATCSKQVTALYALYAPVKIQ
jgi:hypothetical protein